MAIHLCIEVTDKEESKETLNSIEQYNGKVTYQTYTSTVTSIQSMWKELSALQNNTYLLFLKEGDKLILPDSLNNLSTDVDLYFLLDKKVESYPNIKISPFSLSNFYAGKYNNYNFLIKAELLSNIKPNLAFGKAWIMDIVLSLLFKNNALACEQYINILAPGSPSLINSIGEKEIRLKVIPANYGYHLSDMMIQEESGAKNRYKRNIKRRIKDIRINAVSLFIKSITQPERYKQFYRVATFKSKYADNWNQIPVIINNFNRLEYLTQLIASLEKRGVKNIHILDNNSTYVPLLEFYKTTPYKVYHLGNNLGYRALWKSGLYDLFKDDYYAYTDPDLVICDECPNDFMTHFMSLHKKYNAIWKIGFSLKTDDLPRHFCKRREVQHWERQFQEIEVEKDVFYAPIDTTFAIYKPLGISTNDYCLRVSGNYAMNHLPWYVNSEHLSLEETYYVNSCTQLTHWSVFK